MSVKLKKRLQSPSLSAFSQCEWRFTNRDDGIEDDDDTYKTNPENLDQWIQFHSEREPDTVADNVTS